jgi:hypothetical protein
MGIVKAEAQATKSYMVTHVPLSVWNRLRARAFKEGITVKDLFRRWIQQYAEGK